MLHRPVGGQTVVGQTHTVAAREEEVSLAVLAHRVAGVDVVLAGETSGLAQPTSIRDARSGRLLR